MNKKESDNFGKANIYWRSNAARLRLEGGVCNRGHKVFPKHEVCPKCAYGEDTIPTSRRIQLTDINESAVEVEVQYVLRLADMVVLRR